MNVSLLMLLPGFQLILMFGVGAKKQEVAGSPEDPSTRLRGLWRLHMRDTLLKGKGSGPHPMRGGVKQQLLYCRVGIGYHLQILPSGSVGGVHKPTEHCELTTAMCQSWLKVFAMKHGVVGVRGVKSGLYLCLSAEGCRMERYVAHRTLTHLHYNVMQNQEKFSDECLLKENLEENHYNTYSSLSHPDIYLALSHKGALRRGNSVGRHQSCTHFLPENRLIRYFCIRIYDCDVDRELCEAVH
ncbi:hypothetical protein F7725_001529 [Dissostichus mawsoni]|uniref:Fibroblast growth factor n=1 Tax=Dissostichus mawsoni TaxID=36200 RepID=A0A7J5Y012_DISMA|nr:hypothetical protein F7725_001529 [Dissostichus mawsoni]